MTRSPSIAATGLRLKQVLPLLGLAIAIVAFWMVYRQVKEIDPARLLEQLRSFSPQMIGAAAACVAAAFIVFAVYEAFVLNRIQPSIGWLRPFFISLIVSPIGHTVGLSTLSAGALRYRFYSPLGLSAAQVGNALMMCALPFILGMGALLDVCLVFDASDAARALHLSVATVLTVGCLGLLKDVTYPLLTLLYRRSITLGRFSFYLPDIKLTLLQFVIGVADAACISGVLYIFMPAELELSFSGFLVVYLIATLAGSLSTVPAGLGVLEAALLLMLPQVPTEKLLAAVVGYRVVFEIVPLIAATSLLALYELGSRYGVAGRLWRKRSMR